MRLIDADKLLEGEHFILKCKSEFGITEMDVFRREVIDNAPTVDIQTEVWELYKRYQPYLATHVYEFGVELQELLDRYGGAKQ